MSGSKRKRIGSSGSGTGRARVLDVGESSWVVVRSPDGIPPQTAVEIDGAPNAMRTEVPLPLSVGRHEFRIETGDRTWDATVAIGPGGSQSNPRSVRLPRAGGGAGAFSILRPTDALGSVIAAAGQPAEVRTVVYVHGIGNKPPAAVLRCQWDNALFGHEMGDRSRMAYWVDRDRYPKPLVATCGQGDLVSIDDDEASTAAILALSEDVSHLTGAAREEEAIQRTIRALTPDEDQRATLRTIAARTVGAADDRAMLLPGMVAAKIIPLPEGARRAVARLLTRAFLPDVHDFLFDPAKRQTMEDALLDRLRGGGEPFVVVAHSQGSMIAYDVLRRLKKADCEVALFVTIGSPLGLQEVKDNLQQTGPLDVPNCVSRWVNFADPLDPVAIDPTLADDYAPNGLIAVEDVRVHNLDSPLHPHSGTGYLGLEQIRGVVRQMAGIAFVQRMTEMVVTRDIAAQAENAVRGQTHNVLIQLSDTDQGGVPRPLLELTQNLVDGLQDIAKRSGRLIDPPDVLRRFVAARLTATEIDGLRTLSEQLRVKQVWANAEKRTLISSSVATIQVTPARLGYKADGAGINWAVLDTGIDDGHPHFSDNYQNVRRQWDCTVHGAPQPIPLGTGTADPHGHGTHVAGIIAGALNDVAMDRKPVSLYGMAPQAGLYGFRVLDQGGRGNDAWIIKALDMIADLNEQSSSLFIHGLNLSLGSNFDPSIYGCGHTPLCQELRRLWRQGVVVCIAAGNEGYSQLQSLSGVVNANMALSIGDPANLDEAIAVGSVHKVNPHSYGVSYFSSRGPTADGRRKPDLVAPGEKILSALASGRSPAGGPRDAQSLYVEMSGTSMAAPHVSGLLAAFLSVRREFIGDPDRVKEVLLSACTDLKRDPNMQGAGLPNLVRMVLET